MTGTEKGTALAVIKQEGPGFSEDQVKILGDKLDPAHLKTRKQSGQDLTYIEGWRVIERANTIFGYDGWDRETVRMERTVAETYPKTDYKTKQVVKDSDGKPVFMNRIGYEAKVRVTVRANGSTLVREGTGYGQGVAQDPNQAYEGAIKEAETDAMKRALITLGDQFGLTLYDKAKTNVSVPDYVVRQEASSISAEQLATLRDLMTATCTEEDKFAQHLKVENIEDLPAARYDAARNLLLGKRQKMQGGR